MLTTHPKLPSLLQDCGLPICAHQVPGHFFILGNSTVSCRLLPCCSGSTTGAALPLAELGRWAVEVGSAGNCPGQPGTSHTSPPTTYPPPHLSTGAIMPRVLVQTYAIAHKLILKARVNARPICSFLCASINCLQNKSTRQRP